MKNKTERKIDDDTYVNEDCEKLNKFCNSIDMDRLNQISLSTGKTSFSQKDLLNSGCISQENMFRLSSKRRGKQFSLQEYKFLAGLLLLTLSVLSFIFIIPFVRWLIFPSLIGIFVGFVLVEKYDYE